MKPKILVIEDNEQNLYLVTFLLEQNNCEAFTASNGPDGIRMAEEIVPALILLDIQLPGMDGYAVARKLRLIDSLKDLPIIGVTSYARVGDRELAIAAGCTSYITKPINPDTFMEQIRPF